MVNYSEIVTTALIDLLTNNSGNGRDILLDEEGLSMGDLGPRRSSLYIVVPITVVYTLIFLMSTVGNVSTCIVIARNKSMQTTTNYYLFSLAVSDLLLLVSGLPQEMYSIWSRYPYVFGETFCVLRGLAAETSTNASVLTITAFTVERYVAICHPFLSHTMSKLSRAVKLILIIWLVALSFAVPLALQFGLINTSNDPEKVSCFIKRTIIEHSFEVSTFLFFVAPMTLITVLYSFIGLRLRSSNMMKKNSGNSVRYAVSNDVDKRRSRNQQSQSSHRVLKMLVAVVVAFFICWAPFHAQRLVAIYGSVEPKRDSYMMKVYEIVTYISGILYYVSTTINPILYHIMSNKFREAFKETFSKCLTRSKRRSYSMLSRSLAIRTQGSDRSRHNAVTVIQESTDSGTFNREEPSINRDLQQFPSQPECPRTSTTEFSHVRQSKSSVKNPHNSDHPVESTIKVNTADAAFAGEECIEHSIYALRILNSFRLLTKRSSSSNSKQTTQCRSKNDVDENIINVETEPNIPDKFCLHSFNISNSSLKDIDSGALEDELTIYLNDIP